VGEAAGHQHCRRAAAAVRQPQCRAAARRQRPGGWPAWPASPVPSPAPTQTARSPGSCLQFSHTLLVASPLHFAQHLPPPPLPPSPPPSRWWTLRATTAASPWTWTWWAATPSSSATATCWDRRSPAWARPSAPRWASCRCARPRAQPQPRLRSRPQSASAVLRSQHARPWLTCLPYPWAAC
jgi:hypothetical protein